MTISIEKRERYRGCLLGLAVGDALGTTLEFQPPGSFTPITDMIGGGPFNLKPGQWTDDTSMALCLAESLIECRGFNPQDQMERYVRWWKEGHLSSTGTCFDIGNTTRTALAAFLKTGNPFSGPVDPYSAGNGSLMRLAPVPMFYAGNPREAIEKAGESSKTTHGAPAAVDACRYFGALIVGALNGEDKETLLSDHYCPVSGYWRDHPLTPEIGEIAAGSFKHKHPPEISEADSCPQISEADYCLQISEAESCSQISGADSCSQISEADYCPQISGADSCSQISGADSCSKIRGSGYVVQSLEAALWAFYHSNTFEEGCLMAVNLGDDADTTGAIYGQIAGAYYGKNGIDSRWLAKIYHVSRISEMADMILLISPLF